MILLEIYKKIEFFILRKLWYIRFWSIGKWSIIKYWLYGDAKHIDIWEYVYVWENASIWWLWWVTIWSGTIIWPNVTIRSSNHDYKKADFIPYGPWVEKKTVSIGENCWIWDNVNIVPGAQIGEWSIVWMWSVVSWTIENYSIVVWNPAKIAWKRDIEKYCTAKNNSQIYLKYKQQWK